MIALIVIGSIILYLLIGFIIHVLFTLWFEDEYPSYDLSSGFMMFTWPIGMLVILVTYASMQLDDVTSRICRRVRNKRKDHK